MGRALSGDGFEERAEDGDQAPASRVDDSGAGEDVELARGGFEGPPGPFVGVPGHFDESAAVGAGRGRGGGHGEDGAFHGVGDGPSCGARGLGERPGEVITVTSPARTPAMPRSSWERIVPELPRAPSRAPWAMARTVSAVSGAEAAKTASTAWWAASAVRYRLVPVSPSATGYTLIASISSRSRPSASSVRAHQDLTASASSSTSSSKG